MRIHSVLARDPLCNGVEMELYTRSNIGTSVRVTLHTPPPSLPVSPGDIPHELLVTWSLSRLLLTAAREDGAYSPSVPPSMLHEGIFPSRSALFPAEIDTIIVCVVKKLNLA